MNPQPTESYAQTTIRELLAGNAPSSVVLDRCGVWQESIQALLHAHQQGGSEGVRKVFNVLVKQQQGLSRLVASDPATKLFWTAEEILNTEYPPLKWVVPDIIPEGLSLLGGRPKVGKSWLALQIAYAVATGGQALGKQLTQGRVIYIDREDSQRRISDRLHTIGASGTKHLLFAEKWPSLERTGIDLLAKVVEQEAPTLVILDTFTRMLEKSDQTNSSEMAAVLGPLQSMTIDYGFSLHILDHHNKMADPDADLSQSLFGSVAKAGVADVLVGLFRTSTEREGRLKVTGRDVDDLDFVVHMSEENAVWTIVGNATAIQKETNKDMVLQAVTDLVELGQTPYNLTIAKHIGMNTGNVNRLLQTLLREGKIIRGKKQGKIQPYLPAEE
jgi:RecA-family ATPase